jgi:hypothetical protein
MLNAFGIVYSSVAGNHQVTRDASLMKRLQPALAAHLSRQVVSKPAATAAISSAPDRPPRN